MKAKEVVEKCQEILSKEKSVYVILEVAGDESKAMQKIEELLRGSAISGPSNPASWLARITFDERAPHLFYDALADQDTTRTIIDEFMATARVQGSGR